MREVCENIKKIEEITLADVITGGFDVIANVNLPSYGDLKNLVDAIHKIQGVVQTLTCVSLHSCGTPMQ
jgi:hypothetical protein